MKIPLKFGDMGRILEQIGTYPHVPDAYKEYTSNAADSRISGQTLNVLVLVDRNGRIIFQDDGAGISAEELYKIPEQIGDSIKRGRLDQIGEKAVGIFAYHTFGSELRLYTRTEDAPPGLVYHLFHHRGSKNVDVDRESLEDIPYGPFERGTRVLVDDLLPGVLERQLRPETISESLGEMYDPLLRRGEIILQVGDSGRRRLIKVRPFSYRGKLLEIKPIELEIEDPEHGRRRGNIEFYIFVEPDAQDRRVKLYNKGVKVLGSMSARSEFANKVWKSGKLSGYVNDDFLGLTLHRGNVIPDERFRAYVEAIREVESYLARELKQTHRQRQKDEIQKFADYFIRTLGVLYREIAAEFDELRLGGGEKPIVDPPTGGDGRKTPSIPRGPRGPYGPRVGTLPEYLFEPIEFDQNEMHLRSKANHELGKIFANSAHVDYKSASEDDQEFKEYVSFLISKEMASALFRILYEDRKITPEEAQRLASDIQAEFYLRGTRVSGVV